MNLYLGLLLFIHKIKWYINISYSLGIPSLLHLFLHYAQKWQPGFKLLPLRFLPRTDLFSGNYPPVCFGFNGAY